jgi:ligand-binding sensor domain-containing protein
MKQITFLFIILFSSVLAKAQTYKYIGTEDGLSDRRVHYIQKDKRKYMWFLTHGGIDRYNGSEFKQYNFTENGKVLDLYPNLGWLYVDKDDEIWEIGKNGSVFKYNATRDDFQFEYKIPEKQNAPSPLAPVSYSFIDQSQNIWLCGREKIYLYHMENKQATSMVNVLKQPITNVVQQDSTHFFIGTENGVQYVELKAGELELLPLNGLQSFSLQVSSMY